MKHLLIALGASVSFLFVTLLVAINTGEVKYREGYNDCGLYQLQHKGKNCPIIKKEPLIRGS